MLESVFPKIEVRSITLNTNSQNETIVTLLFSAQESIESDLTGTWFTETDILNSLKVEIYQFLNQKDEFEQSLLTGTIKQEHYPIKVVRVNNVIHPIRQSRSMNSDGSIKFELSFSDKVTIPGEISDLAYAFVPKFDERLLAQRFGVSEADIREVFSVHSRPHFEQVMSDGEIDSLIFLIRKQNGEVWNGESIDPSLLYVESYPNYRVQDFRKVENKKEMSYRAVLPTIKFNRDTKISQRNIFSNLFLARGKKGEARGCFFVDLKEMIRQRTQYSFVYEMLEEQTKNDIAKNLKFDFVRLLRIRSDIDDHDFLVPVECRTPSREEFSPQKNHIAVFQFKDEQISEETYGRFRYSIEFSFRDPVFDLIKNAQSELSTLIHKIEEILSIAERTGNYDFANERIIFKFDPAMIKDVLLSLTDVPLWRELIGGIKSGRGLFDEISMLVGKTNPETATLTSLREVLLYLRGIAEEMQKVIQISFREESGDGVRSLISVENRFSEEFDTEIPNGAGFGYTFEEEEESDFLRTIPRRNLEQFRNIVPTISKMSNDAFRPKDISFVQKKKVPFGKTPLSPKTDKTLSTFGPYEKTSGSPAADLIDSGEVLQIRPPSGRDLKTPELSKDLQTFDPFKHVAEVKVLHSFENDLVKAPKWVTLSEVLIEELESEGRKKVLCKVVQENLLISNIEVPQLDEYFFLQLDDLNSLPVVQKTEFSLNNLPVPIIIATMDTINESPYPTQIQTSRQFIESLTLVDRPRTTNIQTFETTTTTNIQTFETTTITKIKSLLKRK